VQVSRQTEDQCPELSDLSKSSVAGIGEDDRSDVASPPVTDHGRDLVHLLDVLGRVT